MPVKRNARPGRKMYRKRRTYARRYKRRQLKATKKLVKSPVMFPDMYTCKLKYVDRVLMTSTTGTPGTLRYRGNSVYDPTVAAGGGQPAGFDQLAQIYDVYKVNASTIKCKFIDSGSVPCEFAIIPLVGVSTPLSIDPLELREQPYSAFTIKGSVVPRPTMLSKYMSTLKIFGQSKTRYIGEKDFQAGVTTVPNSQWQWLITFVPIDRTTTHSIYAYVEITYYVTFNQRKELIDT